MPWDGLPQLAVPRLQVSHVCKHCTVAALHEASAAAAPEALHGKDILANE
jgi:hypothetical protein